MSEVDDHSPFAGKIMKPSVSLAPAPPFFPSSQVARNATVVEEEDVWYDALDDIDMLITQGTNLALDPVMRTPPRNPAAIRENIAGQGDVPPAPSKVTQSASYTSLFGESPLPSYENIAEAGTEEDVDEFFAALEAELFHVGGGRQDV